LIVNASPLIIFGTLDKLEMLRKVCTSIEISQGVYDEVVVQGIKKDLQDARIIKAFVDENSIKVKQLSDTFATQSKRISEIYSIEQGEAETISLALQAHAAQVVIDEIAAREAAKAFGLQPIGSLRILLLAYKDRMLSRKDVKDLVNQMVRTKYRFSPQILLEFWHLMEKVK
tara:strand:+ start:419 stop:934 length:516 start_codon:yes stop_codon:yes gene_type:complete